MAKKHTVIPGFRDGYSGRLVVDRYEFQGHIAGATDNHNAAGITVSGNLTNISSPTGPADVQAALGSINTYIGNQVGVGQGFITVGGQGYDTWYNADGNVNYDKTIPALDTLLNPVFNAIINGTTIDPAFSRIKRGGIVLIKAGTYIIRNTINVPAGIILMGEGYGTKIVNATRLDLSGAIPSVSVGMTPLPLFRIKADANRTINDGVLDVTLTNLLDFQRQTKICNMVISDNFVENTQTGDFNYKIPQNTSGLTPLIIQEAGSNCLIDNVMLTGRVQYNNPSIKIVTAATRFAVAIDTSTTSPSGTYLKLNECIIDGFSQPVYFAGTAYAKDFLEIANCKVRSLGYLDGDSTSIGKNCFFYENSSNTRIVNNHLWGNHLNCRTALYITNLDTTNTDPQSRSKILVSGNNIVIDKASVGSPAFLATSIDTAFTGSVSKVSIFDAFNNYQYDSGSYTIPNAMIFGSSLLVNGSSEFVGNAKFDAAITKKIVTITTSTYTIDSSTGDCTIFVNTVSNPISITLPIATSGREITIKDIGGVAQTNNITLIRNGGTGTIDGYSGNRIISSNYTSWTLEGDASGNWWIV